MSYLTEDEIASLRIDHMIIHLVDKQKEFKPEDEITVQQEDFFKSRIIDHAACHVHSFTKNSLVRPILLRIANGELDFQAGGQALALQFWNSHVQQSTSGAFFVFQLSANSAGTILFALIKYDYRSAVEHVHKEGQSELREIIQAFVKEKRAVQKFCLARFKNGIIEDIVSATDRMAEAPDLTDYFESYLGVSRSRDVKELSARLNETLRSTLKEIREHLPNNDVGAAMVLAKQALLTRETVSNDDVVDAVLHAAQRPTDEKIKTKIEKATRRHLKHENLTDVKFRPEPETLKTKPRRKVRTAEGVRLEYPEDELGHSVTRSSTPEGEVFTIKTSSQLVEDDTIKIPTRTNA